MRGLWTKGFSILCGVLASLSLVASLNLLLGRGFELWLALRNSQDVPILLALAQSSIGAALAALALRQASYKWWVLAPLSAILWLVVVLPVTQYALDQFDPVVAVTLAILWSATGFPVAVRASYRRLLAEPPPNISLERTREG
jgi:hypothetical protein